MRKCIFSVIFIFMLVLPAFGMRNSPEGFRGVMWGMKPEQVEGLELVGEDRDGAWYVREGDRLVLGDASLQNIGYVFDDDYGFYMVALVATGRENMIDLISAMLVQFGSKTKSGGVTRMIEQWVDDNARVYVEVVFPNFDATALIARSEILKRRNPDHPMNQLPVYRVKNVPDGFGKLKWGDRPQDMEGLRFVREYDASLLYVDDSDGLKFGDCELDEIEYEFDKRHGFLGISFHAKGVENFEKIRSHLESEFGEPILGVQYGASWSNDQIVLSVQYREDNDEVLFSLADREIFNKNYYERNKEVMDRIDRDFRFF